MSKKTRVAVVGCGSVSRAYIPRLKQSEYVELVAVCDNLIERAQQHATTYDIPHYFGDIDRMLAEVDFELLVNLTPMPYHAPFNHKGIEAGKHVWCEKPIATNLIEAHALLTLAKERNVGIWCAPNAPTSPAFRTMAEILASKEIGNVYTAHGLYGWSGPEWAGTAWYYKKGGGALFDLGVYNVTTITALLEPVRAVSAMAGSAIKQRIIDGATVDVEAEDNVAIILDHGNTTYSVIQTGFVYGGQREDWTIQLIGTRGAMTLGGYDWEPRNVTVYTSDPAKKRGTWEVRSEDQQGYHWAGGASYIAECLARDEKPMLSGEHAVHVLEVMLAALASAETGERVTIASVFPWPLL